MKKIYLFVLMIGCVFSCYAQATSIYENFNTVCVTAGMLSDGDWIEYNAISPVDSLAWNCTPNLGRDGTPGVRCMGYYSGAYHLDTAWLFTPAISLYTYPDSVFLRFDSKYEVGYGVGTHKSVLSMLVYRDSGFSVANISNPSIDSDITLSLAPVIGPSDSLGWVTHQLNLTPYKTYPSIRIAWKYISTSTDAGAWTIDNVNTTRYPLGGIGNIVNNNPIQLSANYNNDQLKISFYTQEKGDYKLKMYDIAGREVLERDITATGGKENINLDQVQYKKGLYVLKMWNSLGMSVAKVAVY